MSTEIVELSPLDKLDPRYRRAVVLYLDPGSPTTFGKKGASAEAAGIKGRTSTKLFSRPDVIEAMVWINAQRDEEAKDVAVVVERFTPSMVMEIASQIGIGRELEIHDPSDLLHKEVEPIMGVKINKDGSTQEVLVGWDDGHLKQAKEMTSHNRAVAALMKERREAGKMFWQYSMGMPQQRVELDRKKAHQGAEMLAGMDNDEIADLYKSLVEVIQERRAATPKSDDP